MKKTITFIMALVLAATALCGCTDEDQSSTSVSGESSDVSLATTAKQTSAEDKDAAENTNDTDNTENSVEPEDAEDTENTEGSNTNSDINWAVKQLALQELTAIKDNDLEKYLELTNIDNLSNKTIKTLFGEDANLTDLKEELKEEFYDAQKIINRSETDFSDLEIADDFDYYNDEDNQCEIYGYGLNWRGGDYTADLIIICKTNGAYFSYSYIEDVDEENAGTANSIAQLVFTSLNSYCEKQIGSGGYDTTQLTGSYYIGPDARYDNEVMTNFVEEWLPRTVNIEYIPGLLYIQIGNDGFPTLVQWAESEDSKVIGQYPNADENGDVEFLW